MNAKLAHVYRKGLRPVKWDLLREPFARVEHSYAGGPGEYFTGAQNSLFAHLFRALVGFLCNFVAPSDIFLNRIPSQSLYR